MIQPEIDFTDLVGAEHFFVGEAIEERYKVDLAGCYPSQPLCVVRPGSVAEVVEIVRRAEAASLAIVPLGGNSGMSGGAMADGAIKLSLERLNRIHEIDRASMTMTVDAGVTLQAAQEAAEAEGLLLPLDLGSRGSATIGGVLSTNAGGNRVLRWGMARDMALGLEAVLADGSVVSAMGKMIKDNAGYNWKQLLIGSEGTLGIITKAVLRLRPQPTSSQTALLALPSFDAAIAVLGRLQADLSGRLSSFELMWDSFYDRVTTFNLPVRPRPLPLGQRFYCIVEALGGNAEADDAAFQAVLVDLMDGGTVSDAIIAQSERERADIWAVREAHAFFADMSRFVAFDVSMAQSDMAEFQVLSEAAIKRVYGQADVIYYGHVGDGNMHVMTTRDPADPDFEHNVEVAVFEIVSRFGGSISGEHGVGTAKPDFLKYSRSPAEIGLMTRIKRALDPANLLNPGKILPAI